MSADDQLDAMHRFLDDTAAIRGIGSVDDVVHAVVDGNGAVLSIALPESLRNVRVHDLEAAVLDAVAKAQLDAAEQRGVALASLHSSLTVSSRIGSAPWLETSFRSNSA